MQASFRAPWRAWVHALLLAAVLSPVPGALAQPYPNRPVKFVVPFPPGGNLDFIARVIQPKLAEYPGQPVVIDNKGGAGGIVGAEYAAKQPNDGYTIFLGNTGTMGIYPVVYPTLPYDALKDFTAVGITSANAVLAVIHPSVPAGTPPAAIAKLSEALLKTLAQPQVRERFAGQGLDVASSTPEQFGAHIRAEIEKWGSVAKTANIKIE